MRRFTDLLKRFRRDESGAFLVLFAVIALVLIATSGAVVDFTYMQTARSRAQNALDAAALALQSRISIDSNALLKSKAQTMMSERIADSSIIATVNTATIDVPNGKLNFQAQVQVPTAFIQLVGIRSITAQLTSEVTQGSKNLEVSLALDTTGSMGGSKLTALKSATYWMIDNLIKDQQPPTVATYTRMAIVPWSAGVLPPTDATGARIKKLRGTPVGSTAITNITWKKTAAFTINTITLANPAVATTSAAHGLATNDYIYINGVNGLVKNSVSLVPDGIYKVTVVNTTQVKLYKSDGTAVVTNGSGTSAYSTTTKGKLTGCFTSTCNLKVTSAAHGLALNDYVYLSSIQGMTTLNDSSGLNSSSAHPVGAVTTNDFILADETVSTVGATTTYTANTGTAQCVKYGCAALYFPSFTRSGFGNFTYISASGNSIYYPNNCVTERQTTTGHAYDDATPAAGAYLGIQYAAKSSGTAVDCPSEPVQPLTDDKDTLNSLVDDLSAGGSTAGHMGLAWGWYMLAPRFNTIWPTAYAAAAYGQTNLIKAVVLMTDGLFNLQYADGSQTDEDPADGVSNLGTFSSATPNNGYSRAQASALCDAIKADANKITLYTVGFDMADDSTSLTFLQGCASATSDFIEADTTDDLQSAFEQIARNLNELRISK